MRGLAGGWHAVASGTRAARAVDSVSDDVDRRVRELRGSAERAERHGDVQRLQVLHVPRATGQVVRDDQEEAPGRRQSDWRRPVPGGGAAGQLRDSGTDAQRTGSTIRVEIGLRAAAQLRRIGQPTVDALVILSANTRLACTAVTFLGHGPSPLI